MQQPANGAPFVAVGLLSAAALTYEVLLIRVFATVHWHHLVATAISLALLGYGASGTFLALFGQRLKKHFDAAFVGGSMLFGLSSLACVAIAQRLPFDPLALTWDAQQIVYLAGTFLVLALPFFAAASCIGLALWRFPDQIPRLYGYDLIGAGLGAVALMLALALLAPADTLLAVCIAALAVAVIAAWIRRWHPLGVTLLGVVLAMIALLWARPTIEPAAYKDLAQSLATVGARLDTEFSGVVGAISVVLNDTVPTRQAPGLSLQSTALPPRQLAVFLDGDAIGALVEPGQQSDTAAYLGDLISALPYTLFDAPRVAVLNAGVGLAVQQALHLGAAAVAAVEPNPQLHTLICDAYAQDNEALCRPPRVGWHLQTARSFFAGNPERFDLIALRVAADPTGLDAMKSDFDLTREAMTAYLTHLAPGGFVAIEGPTRSPPRLSLRVLATARAALLQTGVSEPALHIAMLRGWQRFNLLIANTALSVAQQTRIREFAAARGFDLVWLPQMQAEEANRFQQFKEAQYYLGAAELLGDRLPIPEYKGRFAIAPAIDDRPFPYRFTRWSEWYRALRSGDRADLAQLDTGLYVATATLSLAALISALLILVPLAWVRHAPGPPLRARRQLQTLAYFGLLGLAFLFIEIAWIERLQRFLGHPVYATTAVLVAFLVFAGLGSLWSQGRMGRERGLLVGAVTAIVTLSLTYVLFLPGWLNELAALPLIGRLGIAVVFMAPLAFAMGLPFPTGLRALGKETARLVPWAWGINGCMSVISAAAAPLVASEIGFTGLIAVAVLAYLSLPLLRLVDNRLPARATE